MWGVAKTIGRFLPDQDGVAASVLLFCVLAVATAGDRVLAVAASVAASLSFSYYFVDTLGSLRITTTEGAVSFVAMVFTALTGSHLAIRAQRRAAEAERRRGEMERLQQLGASLLATDTVSEAAEKAIREIVRLFGGGAILRVDGMRTPFQAGDIGGPANAVVRQVNLNNTLELYAMEPSVEVQSALVNLLGLVLDRAAAAEERSRIESARRGDELRTTVLNALAHNFKTPLTCIKAAASMMRGSATVPATYSQELVEVIDEEADRLDELIRDSLDLARIQSRRANPRVEACTLESIVSGVLEKMKRYLVQQVLVVSVPDDLPVVCGDRFLFEQMVTQVMDNAWKYAGTGARIWISARQAGDEVILTIQNEGSQIPDEERGLVFDRFYRGSRYRARVEGTGLGLAIAKTIAEAHGGRVWLDAEPDGPAFRFALPAGAPEEDHDREPHYIAD
jgi:two-component system, OmpR family, sensor histidine kinase KdpD